MWKWKAFDQPSWNALLSSLARLKGAADGNASAVSDLGKDLATLAELTAGDLSKKQDKQTSTSCSIPTTGWAKDATADYPHYYDLLVSGLTAKDRAEVTLAPASLKTAVKCGLCQTCETLAGKIRLRAASVPSAALTVEYWIEQGKE